jgi:hypothetical protein
MVNRPVVVKKWLLTFSGQQFRRKILTSHVFGSSSTVKMFSVLARAFS